MPAKFEIYKDRKGEFRFRLKASNGEPIATGESYPDKASCKKGIASIKKSAPDAEIVDLTVEAAAPEKKTAAKAGAKTKAAGAKPKAAAKTGTGKPRGRPRTKAE